MIEETQEIIEEDDILIQQIGEAIISNLRRTYGKKHVSRQFHAKMHGCVAAELSIPADLPEKYQFGIFQPGKTYPAWVRFSNGGTRVDDDRKADLRGMAIKLYQVEAEQEVQDHSMSDSHDFLLVTYPTLMASSIKEFKKSVDAVCGGFWGLFTFIINPFNWPIVWRTVLSMKKHKNLLNIPYFSVSPYALGPEMAVKYRVSPVSGAVQPAVASGKDSLRGQLEKDLTAGAFTYNLEIQFQEDPARELLEDLTKEWKTPFYTVGVLTIYQLSEPLANKDELGDNLTFSPWHVGEMHQPLGKINFARKEVYDRVSKFRIEHNLPL